MKNTQWMKWACCMIFVCGIALSATARKEEVTLVLVPRDESVKQVGLDLAARYPTLLIGYRILPNNAVSLHGWTGRKWVNVSLEDYAAGNFFQKGPNSALIIEKKGASVPAGLIPPESWCAEVSKITTADVRPLLHLVGQYYDFRHKDWKWFANRYSQEIDAINPEGLNMAWYHKRLGDHLKEGKPVGSDDLQYWSVIRRPAVAEQEFEPAGETPLNPDESLEDPFTNAVAPAVVMGAGDVPEEEGVDEDPAALPDTEKNASAPEDKAVEEDAAE